MATVVSVNVGLPREVEWQGKTIRTAIWKYPVLGRVFAGRLNLTGDGQADLQGHGGEQRAIMVYQLDSYRYWEKHLGRPKFDYGMFGENLTVDGLADAEVCIGDRFRIGSGVFEVSQPRVTCYRVGVRLNHPEMPALLVSHRRPGFYLRVIQEGEVGAGDRIEKIADGPERMTVAEIDALLYTAEHPADALRRALRIPALSAGWRGSMKALLAAAEDDGGAKGNAGLSPMPATAIAWRGFRSLKVMTVTQESADVRSFELAAADGTRLPDALPGQYILVRLRPSADRPAVVRNYSLCGPSNAGTYTIGVKNEGGAGSAFLHQHVKLGDLLDVGAPRGTFTLAPGTAPVVLLSAGVGVTPLLGMLHAAASDGGSARDVWWIHSARDAAHHSFARQARRLLTSLRNGHYCNIYSRPSAVDRLGLDYDRQGHVTGPLLQQLGVPRHADFYLCGPSRYLADVQAVLHAWSVDRSRVHTEVFGPVAAHMPGMVGGESRAPHVPAGAQGTGPLVSFTRSGLGVRWDARFNNLLELAEACSVPVRWSCRTGVCHNCESGLIDGQLRYSPEPLDPPPQGIALICCSTPVSDVALDL